MGIQRTLDDDSKMAIGELNILADRSLFIRKNYEENEADFFVKNSNGAILKH